MIDSGIYIIENTITKKVYVGSSKNMRKRELEHMADLRAGKHHSRKLQNAFIKYGEAAFVFTRMIACPPDFMLMYEQRAIDAFNAASDGYNICPTAGSCLGKKMRPESVAKASAARKGQKRSAEVRARMSVSQTGKKRAPEAVAKIAAKNTGRKMSKEAIDKMIATRKEKGRTAAQLAHMAKLHAAQIGKSLSLEHRAKMSESRMGRVFTEDTRTKISEANKRRWRNNERG